MLTNIRNKINLKNSSFILALALPVMGTQIANTMVQIVDTMFIGRINNLSLGAVALTGTLIWNLQMVSEGFATGLTATISRRIGEKQPRKASDYLRTGLISTVIFSLFLLPIVLLGTDRIFVLMKMPEELYPMAKSYFQTFVKFLPFIYGLTALQAAFNASGETKTTLMVSIFMNIINIILDWALIFGHLGLPEMGIAGAALASGISFSVGFITLLIISFSREWSPLKGTVLFSVKYLKMILKIGIPGLISYMAMGISQMLVMILTVTPLGSFSLGAFHIVMKLASISFMPGFGFAIAASTCTGQSLGEGDPKKARTMTMVSAFYCTIVMALISITYYTIPDFMISLFTKDNTIALMAKDALRVYASFAVFLSGAMVFGGTIRGAGDSRFDMVLMIFSRFVIRLPAAWLLGIYFDIGLTGIWFAMCFDFLVRGFVLWLRFRGGKWEKSIA